MDNNYNQEPASTSEPGFVSDEPVGGDLTPQGGQSGEQSESQTGLGKGEKLNPAKLFGLIVLGLLFLVGGVYGVISLLDQEKEPVAPQPDPTVPINSEIEVSELDLSFLKMENDKANIIYSPLSIKYGTSLLRDGASGDTKTEIDNVLGDLTLTKYENKADILSLANAVIIRNDFKDNVVPEYIDGLEKNYNAEVLYDELKDASAVDNWINQKTFGLIKTSGVNITPESRMVLANALAIQMDWARRFEAESTYGRDFTKADGTTMIATTMLTEDHTDGIKYYVDDDVTVVSKDLKDYDGTQLEFIAIMPSGDLSEYIESVRPDTLNEALGKRQGASNAKDGVILRIPKFKFEYQLKFIEDLKELGMKTAFDDSADFSLMNVKDELKVGDAVHKATIDFSENGIKAAAITVFVMDEKSAIAEEKPQPVEINIDKPFLFMICDKNTGENWFVGAVYEPNLWGNDAGEYNR